MSDGFAQLDAMIAGLQDLSRLDERTAQIAAPLLDEAVKRTASAGTSPSGVPWAPTKDGRRAMVHAAKAVATVALGNVVRQTLTGPEVFWHYGKGGAPRRPIIPDAGGPIPKLVSDVVDKARAKALSEILGVQP